MPEALQLPPVKNPLRITPCLPVCPESEQTRPAAMGFNSVEKERVALIAKFLEAQTTGDNDIRVNGLVMGQTRHCMIGNGLRRGASSGSKRLSTTNSRRSRARLCLVERQLLGRELEVDDGQ